MTLFESLYQSHPKDPIGILEDINGTRYDLYYSSPETMDRTYTINEYGIIHYKVFDIAVIRDIKYRHIPNACCPTVYFTADKIDSPFDQYTGELYFDCIPSMKTGDQKR